MGFRLLVQPKQNSKTAKLKTYCTVPGFFAAHVQKAERV